MYLGQGVDFKLTTELSEKVSYPHNQAIKNGLNEAILLIWIKKFYCQDKILCVSSNKDLILYEGDSNFFVRATSENTHV